MPFVADEKIVLGILPFFAPTGDSIQYKKSNVNPFV